MSSHLTLVVNNRMPLASSTEPGNPLPRCTLKDVRLGLRIEILKQRGFFMFAPHQGILKFNWGLYQRKQYPKILLAMEFAYRYAATVHVGGNAYSQGVQLWGEDGNQFELEAIGNPRRHSEHGTSWRFRCPRCGEAAQGLFLVPVTQTLLCYECEYQRTGRAFNWLEASFEAWPPQTR